MIMSMLPTESSPGLFHGNHECTKQAGIAKRVLNALVLVIVRRAYRKAVRQLSSRGDGVHELVGMDRREIARLLQKAYEDMAAEGRAQSPDCLTA